MSKSKVLIFSIILFTIFVVAGILFIWNGFYGGYISETVLATGTTFGEELTEIDVRGRARVSKDRQFVSIVIDSPLELDSLGKGIKIPNGNVFNPQITLRDHDGNDYPFTYSGGRRAKGELIANYQSRDTLPDNLDFTTLLLSSEYPFTAKKVLWTGYNLRDLP